MTCERSCEWGEYIAEDKQCVMCSETFPGCDVCNYVNNELVCTTCQDGLTPDFGDKSCSICELWELPGGDIFDEEQCWKCS